MQSLEKLKKSVCFLSTKIEKEDSQKYRFGGTGFFIAVPSENYESVAHHYLVTARHCIEGAKYEIENSGVGGDLVVRVNFFPEKVDFITKGVAESLEVPTYDWIYPDDDAVDIAIRPFGVSQDYVDYIPISTDLFISEEEIKAYSGGDKIYAVGLFTEHYGKYKNYPIIRSGIIASMPDEKLEDENSGLEYDAYLVEMHSIGGLSGSPVLATNDNKKYRVFGLIRGHWNRNREVKKIGFSDDEISIVNSGIAIVTPIQEVHKLLSTKELRSERRRQEEQWIRENPDVILKKLKST